jgi:hypothetical protein
MVKNSSSQNGSAFVIIIVILTVAVIGALSFVFWQNFIQSGEVKSNSSATQEKVEQKPEQLCANNNNQVTEADGVFCSEDIGLEFKVPEIFKGKIQKAENYDIFEGSIEDPRGTHAGKSIVNYEAVIKFEQETLSLSISKEPLRSGRSSIGHALRSTYFNSNDRSLYFVEGVMSEYDSSTNSYRVTQKGYAGEPIPSFKVENMRVYHGKIGDAGVIEDGYLMVVDDYLVIIKIKHAANPMNETTIDYEKPFADLNSFIKQLRVLK